ncbi:T9SS type A sorting domain-containing protein [candidate division KSB1 bacterium]|nr:T9SS type A sorting domain-containing protein [candidate division KSB1 bacterium]
MNLKSIFLLTVPCIMIASHAFSQTWMTYNQTNSGLLSNRIQCIYVDGDGNKWFGTDNGLTQFDGNEWTTTQVTGEQQTLASNNIRDIDYEVTTNGPELWLATDNGVSVVGINVDGLTMATPYRTDNRDLLSNSVNSASVDSEHRRWFGTDAGVTMFNGNDNAWYSFADSLPDYPVVDIGIDNVGGWRYCCTQGGGVGRLKVEVDAITKASVYDSDWSGLMSNDVHTVYVYEDGDQWFGTTESASFHDTTLTKEQWQVFFQYNGLVSDDIRVITVDQSDQVWFGTPAGVSMYNWTNFNSYTTADGLASNTILDIAVDTDGSLWFGTDNGVTHYISGSDVNPDDPDVIAQNFELLPNIPNPFNPSTTLAFELSEDAHVTVEIYNIQGQIIRKLIRENRTRGTNYGEWNGITDQRVGAAAGVYVVYVRAVGNSFESRKSQKILLIN